MIIGVFGAFRTNPLAPAGDEEIGKEGIKKYHLIFYLFFDIIIVGKNEMKNERKIEMKFSYSNLKMLINLEIELEIGTECLYLLHLKMN